MARLIGHNDMHDGNLSFRPRLPLPAERELWDPAARAAVGFWQTTADDARIGATFRATCAANAEALARML